MAIEHLLAALLAANTPSATLDIRIEGARSAKGVFHLCVSAEPKHFPDCSKDAHAIKRTVPASARHLQIGGIPPGRYALTLFHDENNNQRLDTMLGIPREGFGFSRNPTVRFGAPRFRQVEFQLGGGMTSQTLRLQYML